MGSSRGGRQLLQDGSSIIHIQKRVCGGRQISPCQVKSTSHLKFQGFILIYIAPYLGRLGRGALGTSTWGSTSPMGRRWPSSWSQAKPVILSCFMRANYTRFFRQAENREKHLYMRSKNEHFVLMRSTFPVVKFINLF